MTVDIAPATLADCEQIIERGLATFVEVGSALLRIRDERLYRNEFRDFESYCQNRWAMGRREANRLIEASDITNSLGAIAPKNVGQARALSGLDTETAAAVMNKAHEATNGKPTATVITDIRSKFEAADDDPLSQAECEALDRPAQAPAGQFEARAAYMANAAGIARPDDILTEAEWQAADDDDPDDDEPEPEDHSPFIAAIQKTFYTFALAEKRFDIDRIAEIARADPQFAATLREDLTRARRWIKQLDAALRTA